MLKCLVQRYGRTAQMISYCTLAGTCTAMRHDSHQAFRDTVQNVFHYHVASSLFKIWSTPFSYYHGAHNLYIKDIVARS